MATMNEIIPTILTLNPIELEEKMGKLEGVSTRVQIDIIDGIYLPEKTVGLDALKGIETTVGMDIHLMVNEPEEWILRCTDILAERVIGQVEMMTDQTRFIDQTIKLGLGVGLGLDVATPISKISQEDLLKLDLILVMTRKAGSEDSPFEEEALGKVGELRKMGYLGEICVDGGINEENIEKCLKAGANLFAIGNSIWQAPEISDKIGQLNQLINK
jgi:ribulose-phosphate 3-epimerase